MPTKKDETAKETKKETAKKSTAAKSTKTAAKSTTKTAAKKTTTKKTTTKAAEKSGTTKAKTTAKKSSAKKSSAKAAKTKKPEALYYATGRRKNAIARVRLYKGTGKVNVNGRDIKEYFSRQVLVDNIVDPLKITATDTHFDVVANLDGGGVSGQAGALRHGIARALLEAGDYRDVLKKAGYLTRDSRMVERKKYGLKKARKRSQFSKR